MEQEIDKTNFSFTAAVEAILFVYGEPLEIKKIAKILEGNACFRFGPEKNIKGIIETSLEELKRQYENENRGLQLIFQGDKVQLVSKPVFGSILEKFIKEEFKEQLTPASLETLSLI